ncbi:MAG: hypothetical protein WAV28_16170 [Sedimentisphaerales bacterium]|jgi:hypothetical protein
MRLRKIIITVFFIASLVNVNVCHNATFQKEKSDSEDKPLISSGFENVISAAILSRENQTGRKAADPTGSPKPTLIVPNCLSAKNRLFHTGNFESPYAAANGINENTLVSLHCLLTV